MAAALARRLGRHAAVALPQFTLEDLYNLYGQTEMSPIATVPGPADQEREAGSAGRPALNVETRVAVATGRTMSTGRSDAVIVRSPGGLGRAGRVVTPARRAAAFKAADGHERHPSRLA
ncbi:AMP-binding protein [Streptomyces antimycoticus]|uniref:AMP-binding protein n=1 Tax=Streptomyces TaxID=1883 RepID=UPI001FF607F9|nr:AMP-binding protein [Streptomyces sp. AgN23]